MGNREKNPYICRTGTQKTKSTQIKRLLFIRVI